MDGMIVVSAVGAGSGTIALTGVSGASFAQNAQVLITIGNGGGSLVVHTDAAGNFDLPYLAMGHSGLGPRTIDAIVVGTSLKATGTLLVVAGTFQPPDFNGRN